MEYLEEVKMQGGHQKHFQNGFQSCHHHLKLTVINVQIILDLFYFWVCTPWFKEYSEKVKCKVVTKNVFEMVVI